MSQSFMDHLASDGMSKAMANIGAVELNAVQQLACGGSIADYAARMAETELTAARRFVNEGSAAAMIEATHQDEWRRLRDLASGVKAPLNAGLAAYESEASKYVNATKQYSDTFTATSAAEKYLDNIKTASGAEKYFDSIKNICTAEKYLEDIKAATGFDKYRNGGAFQSGVGAFTDALRSHGMPDSWKDKSLTQYPDEIVAPYIPPLNFGKSMRDVMEESDDKHEQRHREQLAAVQRVADAAEASATSAKDSERSTSRSLRNSRIANYLAFGALVGMALVHLVNLPT